MQNSKIVLKKYSIVIAIFFISLLAGSVSFCKETTSFPAIGFIKNNSSNLRAGYNINFESLYKYEKGDPVKIRGKYYEWFKVYLPKKAFVYVKSDYIYRTGKSKGQIKGVNVNLRAGPGEKYSVIAQASGLEEINIASEKDGWSKITPPKNTGGWVHESQIVFNFKEI